MVDACTIPTDRCYECGGRGFVLEINDDDMAEQLPCSTCTAKQAERIVREAAQEAELATGMSFRDFAKRFNERR